MSNQERNSRIGRPNRASVAFVEEQAWVGFYKRIGDPAVAAEVLEYFRADPEAKRTHPALFLRARESMRRYEARQMRARRIGSFVRMAFNLAFIGPALAIRNMLQGGQEIAVQCLPEVAAEPAVRRIKKLSKKPEFAAQRAQFSSHGEPASQHSQATKEEENSPAVKAM